MKKILLILFLLFLVGCEKDLNNTPTKKVEVFLSNYQSLSEEVQNKIQVDVSKMTNLTEEQKNSYVDLWKKHYQGLTYEVKDETVNGDEAIVECEIEVYDYSKILTNANIYLSENPNLFQDELGNYSASKFNDYRLEALKKVEDKVKYTIEFKAKKIEKKWFLQDLSDEEYLKLAGMYIY